MLTPEKQKLRGVGTEVSMETGDLGAEWGKRSFIKKKKGRGRNEGRFSTTTYKVKGNANQKTCSGPQEKPELLCWGGDGTLPRIRSEKQDVVVQNKTASPSTRGEWAHRCSKVRQKGQTTRTLNIRVLMPGGKRRKIKCYGKKGQDRGALPLPTKGPRSSGQEPEELHVKIKVLAGRRSRKSNRGGRGLPGGEGCQGGGDLL